MSSLDYHLEQIKQSSESLKTLYFRPPGIFTNSILSKPEITSLIRDADIQEQSLYKVQNGKPERIDGKSNYVEADQSFTGLNSTTPHIKSAVQIPKLVNHNDEYKDNNLKLLLNKFSPSSSQNDNYNADELCDTVSKLLEKYPIPGIKEKIIEYKQRYKSLNEEISEFEDLVEEQKRQLSVFNININDVGSYTTPSRDNSDEMDEDTNMEESEINIEQVLEEEEQEIRELELKLIEKQRQLSEFSHN